MKALISDKNKCGIYCIRNIVNGKVYIGKAVNIYRRIGCHINKLDLKDLTSENAHFIAAWHKYGKLNFSYCILEECNIDELSIKEVYWMLKYDSINAKKGYNKRLDSSGGMIPHKETKLKLSIATKKRFESLESREKVGKMFKDFWKNNPDKKQQMILNLKISKQKKYKFIQMNEDYSIVKIYNTVEEIIKQNPTYKWQNIYAVCNGYKKRIYGYKWKKELKI